MNYLHILILVFISKLLAFQGLAQKHDYVWTLGYDSNTIDTSWGGLNVDFKDSPPSYNWVYREMDFINNAASICDEKGNLLFYTNGCYIAGADGEMIENGDSLNPGRAYNNYCNFRYPANQAVIIIPAPGEPNQYLVLHKDTWLVVYSPWHAEIFSHHLYYTRVDMQANNGKGKVTEKNVVIFQDTLWSADLTTVKHQNGHDWWVFGRKKDSNRFFKFF